ncbi:MAG: YARHG domain-containing protein [Clostridia bacterium]|nr:YARHG domain-containing protein [Clostridia bacterium]
MVRKDAIKLLCSACGAKLKYKGGLYICENCGNTQTLSSYFENTEVFICYRETDEQGRRTKDSIIAQELYNKLRRANINVFYQRISTGDLTSEDFEEAYYKAINETKIIIMLACNKENFETMLYDNRDYLCGKKVLPVYKDMDAYDIPAELSELQAVNYENIGAIADLEKSILRFLGREKEIDVISIAEKRKKKKKNLIAVLCGFIFLIVVVTVAYYILGTPYVLNSNKYEYAKKLIENGKYISAMETYSAISGYKDTDELLKNLYNKYNGYYEKENNEISLTLQVIDNTNIDISCYYDKTKFSITAPFNINIAEFEFVDSKNNNGQGTLWLRDNGIKISISISESSEINADFSFNDRTDQKTVKYDKELLLSWLSKDVTVDMLKADGYDFEFVEYIHAQLGEIYSLRESSVGLFSGFGENVTALSAPASILCPEKIGQPANPYLDGNIIFAPYGTFPNSSLFAVTSYDDVSSQTIQNDTTVYVTKRELVDEFSWEMMMEDINNTIVNPTTNTYIDESASQNEYLFPSDSKFITKSDLEGKSSDEIALIRNEIFARHGYIFTTEPYITYFNQKSWYVPNSSFDSSMLNSIEKANVDFITQYEKEKGYK